MNERLKDIAIKAQVEHCVSYVRLEEFAKLIVKECVDIVKDSEGYSQYFPHVAENIQKHFGVEQ